MKPGVHAAIQAGMWPYYPDLLETPVPRYTSFPTAAEFSDDVGAGDFASAIDATSGDVSLYVHIPFCERICWYCGCNTGAANREHRLASYLDALHREIALVGARLAGRIQVRRVAFGGGSPNAIAPVDFVRLLDALTVAFRLTDPEISIELDPRTLGQEWGAVIAASRISRASLGVQTFAPEIQQAIGRVQPDAMIENAVTLLRQSGVSSLNFDLMYGLPGQSMHDLDATLERTVELGADRIALFGYAHVPHLIPRQRRIEASALPGQRARFDMAARGYAVLVDQGYAPVGFDHFARPADPLARAVASGTLHRNFQGFTDDDAPVLIGLGVSAISAFPGLLVQNEKNAGRYRMMLSQDRFPATRGIDRGPQDRTRAAAIESLLCRGHADLEGVLLSEAARLLRPFVQRGLVTLDGTRAAILPPGLPYARTIAAQFDPYRNEAVRRFSSAV